MRTLILFTVLIFIIFTCSRDWDNPIDTSETENAILSSVSELSIVQEGLKKVKLSWAYDNQTIQGFKIDRKIGDGDWQLEYAILDHEARLWIDASCLPTKNNSYQVYSFSADKESQKILVSIVPAFPAPTNLSIEQLSITRLKLTWRDNSAGEDGYKIDKKIGADPWQVGYVTLAENSTLWIDSAAVPENIN